MTTQTAQTQTATSVRSTSTLAAVIGAMLIGAAIIAVAGHVQAATLHDAAHDVRHATGFPCH